MVELAAPIATIAPSTWAPAQGSSVLVGTGGPGSHRCVAGVAAEKLTL